MEELAMWILDNGGIVGHDLSVRVGMEPKGGV